MKNLPLFSVITVCRNEAKNIRKTCNSILGQTFDSFEWIVIDGGSMDGTVNILGEYRDRIEVLVSEPDSGIYNAMNKGVARARGEYLVFMNGGDQFSNKDVLLEVSKVPRKDFIFGDVALEIENERTISRSPDILSRHYLMTHGVPHQACYFRRILFEKYGNYDEQFRISSDYELIVRFLYKHQSSFHHISQVLSTVNREGISCDPKYRMARKFEAHRIRKKYYPIGYWFSFQAIKWEIRRWSKNRG